MDTLLLRAPVSSGDTTLPDYELTAAELAVMRMPSLTCWLEVDSGLEMRGGLRWQMRNRLARSVSLRANDPLLVTGSDSKQALQMGYGSADYSSVDRGALRLPSAPDLFGAGGFTVVEVLRVPTMASGESTPVGGHSWACQGAASNDTPRLNISGTTGKTILYGGGKTFSNPPGDLRDGLWHVVTCRLDVAAGALNAYVDHARYVGGNTGATTPIPAGSRVPDLGVFRSSNASPFYGRRRAFLTFNAPLSTADRLAVETYLAGKWGATLAGVA